MHVSSQFGNRSFLKFTDTFANPLLYVDYEQTVF